MADNRQTKQTDFNKNQLDSQLLNSVSLNKEKESSADRVGALREAQRNESIDSSNEDYAPSLRETVLRDKKNRELQAQQNQGGESSVKGAAPIRKGTSSLLRQAWIYLIPSFGLTLIWINIHAFLNLIFGPRYFCNLGEEWIDLAAGGSPQAREAMSKSTGKSVGTVEKMGLGCLNLGCLLLIIALIGFIALIFNVIENPFKFLGQMIGYLWSTAVQGVAKWVEGS